MSMERRETTWLKTTILMNEINSGWKDSSVRQVKRQSQLASFQYYQPVLGIFSVAMVKYWPKENFVGGYLTCISISKFITKGNKIGKTEAEIMEECCLLACFQDSIQLFCL